MDLDAARAPEIIVTHPGGNPQTYHMVAALQARGYDAAFETGFYYKQPGPLSDLVGRLPDGLRRKCEKELRRRFNPGIDSRRVGVNPFLELVYVASARLGGFDKVSAGLLRLRNEVFDRRIAKSLRRRTPDVVIGHDGAALHTFLSARRLGTLTVLDQVIGHVTVGLEILRQEAELCPEFADTLADRVPDYWVERMRREALEADYVMAPSEYVRDTLIKVGVEPGRIALLPFGVETDRFVPSRRTRERSTDLFRLAFVGQIGQRKGIKYLLEAVKRLGLKDAELVLTGSIAGRGEGLARYRGVFRHVPNVPYHQVHSVFGDADVYVYPSLHEGSSVSIFEAMASGLPVITTPNSGSVVRDGEEGFVIPIRDVEALMDRIHRLYRDRELREEMGRKARARAECYTWERYGRSLDAFLRRFMAGKRA